MTKVSNQAHQTCVRRRTCGYKHQTATGLGDGFVERLLTALKTASHEAEPQT